MDRICSDIDCFSLGGYAFNKAKMRARDEKWAVRFLKSFAVYGG
jgi:hypothetical protein